MQPDSEREREWQQRAADLFERAPTPDAARLEAIMDSVHSGRRSRRRRRLAWGAAAVALGGVAAASAVWWPTPYDPVPAAEPQPELSISAGEPEAGQRESAEGDDRETGTRKDGPVIYRRAQ